MADIWDACRNGNTQAVQAFLLVDGIDVDVIEEDEYGDSPLISACREEQRQIVNMLLTAGADVDKVNYAGFTPLMTTAMIGNDDIADMLIAAGADVNRQRKEDGRFALLLAAMNGFITIIDVLIAADANVNLQANQGLTALIMAASREDSDVTRRLLAAGANVHAKLDIDHTTALTLACDTGDVALVDLLLTHGADVNSKCSDGDTALIRACKTGQLVIVRKLIAVGGAGAAIVNCKKNDGTGVTALIMASSNGHDEVVKVLLAAGAVVNSSSNTDAMSALFAACLDSEKDDDVVDKQGRRKIGQQLQTVEVVKLLLAAGAEVNWRQKKSGGRTALMQACLLQQKGLAEKIVATLLDAGADVTLKTKNGFSARSYAEYTAQKTGRRDVCDLLKDTNLGTGTLIQQMLAIEVEVERLRQEEGERARGGENGGAASNANKDETASVSGVVATMLVILGAYVVARVGQWASS